MNPQENPPAGRPPGIYWLIAALIVAYVAACTGHRDNIWRTDAWEHHRVIKALTEDFWHPGNPTYPIDTPTPRYSPYSVFWASVCLATGMDPYDALSLAGTMNTVILLLAVPFLLARSGRPGDSAAALLVMISLYGGIPETTNSYALSDLSWHEVNFSAASFAWSLILLGGLPGIRPGGVGVALDPRDGAPLGVTMLDHPMTGSWAQFGLWLFALAAPRTGACGCSRWSSPWKPPRSWSAWPGPGSASCRPCGIKAPSCM